MKTIKDYNLQNKKVIIRCDFNVPINNGKITDDTRIIASLKTVNYAIENKAKVILMSHLGKIKQQEDLASNTLEPVYQRLKELLNTNVYFSKETRKEDLKTKIDNLKPGEVILIENTRYEDLKEKKESTCDIELSKYWASLGDIFINDAYGTLHRAHASNVGIAKQLPNGIGFLVLEEIEKIDKFLKDPSSPFIVIMGGKKVKDKIKVIDNLITKCDKLLIGGAMSFTFLHTKGYPVNKEYLEEEYIPYCTNLLKNYDNKIILPIDFKVSQSLESEITENKFLKDIKEDEFGYDIGINTIKLYSNELIKAKKVLINGPMGVFENKLYQKGTYEIYKLLLDNNIKTLVGGGDSASSVNNLGFKDKFYHVSTGGGATLEYLEGTPLPGLEVINK